MGKMELIIGPMFSGKSTELLRRCKRHSIANRKVLLVNHEKDTRYGNGVIGTHDGVVDKAVQVSTLAKIIENANEYEVIAIDEGQFFSDITTVKALADKGIIVIVAGLDATFQMQPFIEMCKLVSQAESVTKLTAICSCGKEASFTKRLSKDLALEVIGGMGLYAPVCRTCFSKT